MLMVSRMTYLQIVDYKPCWWLILCIHRIVHRNGRKPSVGRLIGSKTSLLLVSHPRMPVNMTRKQICIYDYFTFQLWDSRIFFCCSWLTDISRIADNKLMVWVASSQNAHINLTVWVILCVHCEVTQCPRNELSLSFNVTSQWVIYLTWSTSV